MKYTFHFRNSDFPLIFTDYVTLRRGYGCFDYVFLQEGQVASGFLSEKGLWQTYSFGKKLLDRDYSDKIISDMEKFEKRLKNLKHNRISKANIPDGWKELDKAFRDFMHFYRYCEKPMLEPLEEKLMRYCPDANKLNEVLHNPTLSKDFPADEQRILHVLVTLGELKYKLHLMLNNLFDRLHVFAGIIAHQYSISADQALALRINEFKASLEGKAPNIELINERRQGCVFLPPRKGNLWQCLVGESYSKWSKILEPSPSALIHGTVAYPGKAIGRVRLHLSLINPSSIKKGEVLVTGMTNPQITPFLRNAIAIVTDEGGITCHAAIVSRELKKPCIIGTKIATKVLKDGDLVEVDANHGVVKILKKSPIT